MEFTLSEVRELLAGKVSYPDLAITCSTKDEEEYKNAENLIQALICRKMRKRGDEMTFSRLSYVVLSGPGKIFNRGESLEYAMKNKLQLDYRYYIMNQLLKSIMTLLDFHPTERQKLLSGLNSLAGQSDRIQDRCQSLLRSP